LELLVNCQPSDSSASLNRLLQPEEEIQLGRQVRDGPRLPELAEELKLRAGGRALSLEVWAAEAGFELPRLRQTQQILGRPLSLCAAARQLVISRDLARGLERRANEAIRRLSHSDLSNPRLA
jgi:hypothetical protein